MVMIAYISILKSIRITPFKFNFINSSSELFKHSTERTIYIRINIKLGKIATEILLSIPFNGPNTLNKMQIYIDKDIPLNKITAETIPKDITVKDANINTAIRQEFICIPFFIILIPVKPSTLAISTVFFTEFISCNLFSPPKNPNITKPIIIPKI